LNVLFIYALVTAAAVVVGGLLITTASPRGRRSQRLLIGFGAGYMLALSILAMVPHVLEANGDNLLGVLVGYLLVHLSQHVLTPHFHFGEETHREAMVGRWVGVSALFGLLLHTFFDGVAIASGFGVSASLGFLVFTGIVLHKIPEGITAASVMLASGNSRGSAIGGVLVLGAATVAGVLLTEYVQPLQQYGLSLSAGVTLYVAASNLVPEVQQERDWAAAGALLLGAASFIVARLILAQFHA
jgi:zinc and cadmium transporter